MITYGSKSVPEMERSMLVTKEMNKMRNSLFWGVVNATLLSLVVYNVLIVSGIPDPCVVIPWDKFFYTYPLYNSAKHIAQYVAAALLVVNTLFHFCRYGWTYVTLQPVSLSPKQRSLLGIKEPDYYFKTATSTPVLPSQPQFDSPWCLTPLNMSTNSWLSSSLVSPCDTNDSLRSAMNSSWLYQSSNTPSRFHSPVLDPSELIQDQSALQHYLKQYESAEKSSIRESSKEQSSNMLSTFWINADSRTSSDVDPLLRRCTYQISLSPAQAQSGVGSGDEAGSPSPYQCAEVWRRNKINPSVLTEWMANLRMWISQTILERLVSEIETVDSALHAHGLIDVSVGVVGLERLKKTAQIPQVMLNVPSLPCLVPFLEISQNQEYLVSRIRELARGGCMSEYRWNSGGLWQGKEWTPALPTDASLVLHLLATYLDSQLPQTSLPDSRPFSSQYLVRAPAQPPPTQLAIVETSTAPPNYLLQTKTDTFHTPKGRNNLFFTILLFLHTVKSKDHGILGRMNLGRSGINILWIIDNES